MARRSRVVSALLLLVVLAVAGTMYSRSRPSAPQPVVVERQVSGTARGITPAPEFLLRHARELALSPAQQVQLQRVAAAYRRDIAPTKQKLDTVSAHYQAQLQQPPGRGVTPQQLSGQAQDVVRLSGAIATTRRTYWEQARNVLTPSQQQNADALARRAALSDLM